ncbi:MAG: alpha/beta hydrolase [Granulosicoccus sp.]|nr:alpha/beta hydrolase [Granulosicoccus sp.]
MSDVFTFHEKFTSAEFDAQYNLRARRPDYEETVLASWLKHSEAARTSIRNKLDIRYSEGDKQLLDVFFCESSAAPTLVYFHGGYWQRGDKSIYSFLAKPFVDNGVNVVFVGYDLCPKVTLTRISEEAREAMVWLWRNAKDIGINRDQITVMGHSAGGHIAEMLMGTAWSDLADDLPENLIKSGIPVSPISYLEPVRLTEILNAGIGMTEEEAERESPMLNHPPATNAQQLVVVGGAETDEFHRQSQMYVDAFNTDERTVELYVVPDVDHFDELNVLTDPSSTFFKKSRALMS